MEMRMPRPHGPEGANRPYMPSIDTGNLRYEQRFSEALDHIAFALAAIDHNLEALLEKVGIAANALHRLAEK